LAPETLASSPTSTAPLPQHTLHRAGKPRQEPGQRHLPAANLIVINDAHVIGRQNNSLAHKLAHIILKHEPAQVFFTADGMMMMTDYNKTHEDEADCLAGTLLVPREALLNLLDQGYSDAQIAEFFGVADDLIRMRKNLTSVNIQRLRRGIRA
jgi:Zn-dependent peptidase ImmA (M78 family)